MSVPSAAAPVRSRTNPPKEVYETGSAPVTGPLVVKAAPVESSGKVSEPSISVSVAKEKFSAAQLNTDHQNYSGALGWTHILFFPLFLPKPHTHSPSCQAQDDGALLGVISV